MSDLFGVSEMARPIVGKAVMGVQAARSLQLCAGQPSGCKAAIHALRHIFDYAIYHTSSFAGR